MTSVGKTLIVLTHIMVNSSVSDIGGSYQDSTFDSSLSYTALSAITQSKLNLNTVMKKKYLTDAWFTNGVYQPVHSLRPTEWYIFDILVASSDRYVDLSIVTTPLTGMNNDNIKPKPTTPVDNGCSIRLLSTDGSYLEKTRLVDHVTLPPGGRVSISIQCKNKGKFYLVTSASLNDNDDNWSVGDYESKSVQPLVVLQVTGDAPSEIFPPPTVLPNTLSRKSLLSDDITEKYEIALDSNGAAAIDNILVNQSTFITPWSLPPAKSNKQPLFWLGFGTDCTLPCYDKSSCLDEFGEFHSVVQYPSVVHKTCHFQHSNTLNIKSLKDSVVELTFYSNYFTSVISIQRCFSAVR
jgi:FtsP/CotA-like multicopper oxidase with cupredoxin domain